MNNNVTLVNNRNRNTDFFLLWPTSLKRSPLQQLVEVRAHRRPIRRNRPAHRLIHVEVVGSNRRRIYLGEQPAGASQNNCETPMHSSVVATFPPIFWFPTIFFTNLRQWFEPPRDDSFTVIEAYNCRKVMSCKFPKTSQRPQKPRHQGDQLFTGAIPNQVRNSQTSRFVSVPGQNPGRSSKHSPEIISLEKIRLRPWASRINYSLKDIHGYEVLATWLSLPLHMRLGGQATHRVGLLFKVRRLIFQLTVYSQCTHHSWVG